MLFCTYFIGMIFVNAKLTEERILYTLDRQLLTYVFVGFQMQHSKLL